MRRTVAAGAVVISFALAPVVRATTIAPPARGPISTGLNSDVLLTAANAPAILARIKAAGATTVRVGVNWAGIAPISPAPGFNPTDPADPQYRWTAYDDELRLITESGLEPVLSVYYAPSWAEDAGPAGPFPVPGTVRPNAKAYGQFMVAIATRYDGTYQGLPRVRYWQIWNEPNIHLDLNPQLDANGQPVSPPIYRNLVNAAAASIHAVHSDNIVIAGGTAPFRDNGYPGDWGPLTFMRNLLCLSPTLKPTCDVPVHFDIWAHNPYTSGDPRHHANLPDDVSLGDLGKMRNVLVAAAAAGHIVSAHPVGFWITEFSWDSNPPDPKGVPMTIETRWVSEMLYRTWLVGIGNVIWLALYDLPMSESFEQAGLFFVGSGPPGGAQKPLLRAFRFPLVAFRASGGVTVWGRTPAGAPATVLIQQSDTGGWKKLGQLQSNRYGIFNGRYRASPNGWVRARVIGTGELSAPFSLTAVPDHFYNPFGT